MRFMLYIALSGFMVLSACGKQEGQERAGKVEEGAATSQAAGENPFEVKSQSVQAVGEGARKEAATVEQKLGEAVSKTEEAATATEKGLSELGQSLKQKAEQAADAVAETADQAKETAEAIGDQAAAKAEKAKEAAASAVDQAAMEAEKGTKAIGQAVGEVTR